MTRRGRGVLEPSEGAGPADPGQDSGLQAVRGCSAAVLSPLVLCFITVSPGNERSRETMESDHRSSARHKLCAPPALSLPGSPSFPAVCAVWDWGRSIHQAEGGLLDPCISVLGSPRPLGRVSRCWVPPKWGRSSHRREDIVQGREGLGQAGQCSGPTQTLGGGGGRAVPRKGLKLQPEHRKEHAPLG